MAAYRIGIRRLDPVKFLRYLFEAGIVLAAGTVLRLLPIDTASALGGRLFQMVGPRLGVHRTAERNLRRAMPELSDVEQTDVLRRMWNNLGRVAAEYTQLDRIAADPERVVIHDPNGIAEKMRRSGRGGIMISGHYGNWELADLVGHRAGMEQYVVYRAPNNPMVGSLLERARRRAVRGDYIPKGAQGMRALVKQLRAGRYLAMLIDQKSNEGIPSPFFGIDAMTTSTPAALARRYDAPILFGRVDRTNGARFQVRVVGFEPTITDDPTADVEDMTRRINLEVESWIRERPDHWTWVHRRWPD